MSRSVDDDALALQRLFHWETTTPERIAFTQPMGAGVVRDFTWREALDQARRMATHLKALGVGPGDRVAILSKNTAHWLMSDYAIWLAGGVSVPLYPTLAASTIRQILEHSRARVVFVGKLDGWEAMRDGIPEGTHGISHPLSPEDARRRYPMWDDVIGGVTPLPGQPVRDGDELATIMYTSGTTGMPKGVMHSFATFAWSVQSGLRRITAVKSESRMLSYLPLAHVAERTLVEHGQLAVGFRVFFAESLDTFTADLQRARPTVFFSVPRLWVKFQQGVLAKVPQKKLDRLLSLPIVGGLVRRKILTALGLDACVFAGGGAAPMPTDLLRWYARLGLEIVEIYGMTENCAVSHCTLPGRQRPGTVGMPFDGVESRLDPGSGEIQMRSPGLMLGYYREDDLTRQTFTDDGWLRTGDKGELDAEGNLRITGRVKDLFKTSKGKYVAPAPIEDRLAVHSAVEACCVTGANLAQPLALVMLNAVAVQQAASPEGRRALTDSLAAHLESVNETLDRHEQMDCLILTTEPWTVENELITPTFKVRRNSVDAVFGVHFERWTASGETVLWHQE